MTPLQQALMTQGGGGGGGGNVPLLSILSLGNQSPPAVPPLGSNLPSYAAGSGGMTVPNAVDIQRANPSLPWYRAPGIFQQPPPPPAAPAAAAASPTVNSPGAALTAANAWGEQMNRQNFGMGSDSPALGIAASHGLPLFTDPRVIQDHLAQLAMNGDQNAAMALQQMMRGGRGIGGAAGGGPADAGMGTGGGGPSGPGGPGGGGLA